MELHSCHRNNCRGSRISHLDSPLFCFHMGSVDPGTSLTVAVLGTHDIVVRCQAGWVGECTPVFLLVAPRLAARSFHKNATVCRLLQQ